MKITPQTLIDELSHSIDAKFAKDIVTSYLELEQRFLAGDWQPAELDGGRLCEAVSWALYQMDTGKVESSKSPYEVRVLLLDKGRVHRMDQSDREHIIKVIESVYKLRSDRGAVHISPKHDANFMDAMLVLQSGKWIFAELLRLAWQQDKQIIGETISQLVQIEHSLVHELDGKPLVMDVTVSTPEEILILLFHAPGHRMSRHAFKELMPGRRANAIGVSISRLLAVRQIRAAENGEVALTLSGQTRVLNDVIRRVDSR